MPPYYTLIRNANELMNKGPWTVMSKPMTPPSGSKHDYESLGSYWWPCNNATFQPTSHCNRTTGLPWVRRDGEHNPETDRFDSPSLGAMTSAVVTLSQAYFFSDNESYAERAVFFLKTWFLNESTFMHPNMNYAQMIPGVTDGRGIGIIDTGRWYALIDAFGLLDGSKSLSDDDQARLLNWYRSYVEWLWTSKNGKDEYHATNNHGTWYDTQFQSCALFIGNMSAAKMVADKVIDKRIKVQIEPNGSMPLEERRTKSKSYCTMNLQGLFNLASVAKYSGIELFNYTSSDGRGIRQAFEFMVPYAIGEKAWPYEQITSYSWGSMFELFRRASIEYQNPTYEQMISKLPDINPDNVINLLYPKLY
ncbi:uncharacterized protein LOC134188745 isoform X2 [Corticium candelabrum]|uniref:uncharacterized protein LOC134188745 isoform X2 n=1 Tax=Corticium candelabrum TaxID=121492 RepID=UPI002E25E712|nr:uncharacterized protein LOC134188745 isoform X2 [Corticium candelabrum]